MKQKNMIKNYIVSLKFLDYIHVCERDILIPMSEHLKDLMFKFSIIHEGELFCSQFIKLENRIRF